MNSTSINASLGTKWFTFYTKIRPVFICIFAVIMSVMSFVDILLGTYPFLNVVDILLYVLQFVLAVMTVKKSRQDYVSFVPFVEKVLRVETLLWDIEAWVAYIDAVYISEGQSHIEASVALCTVLGCSFLWYWLNIRYFKKRLPQEDEKASPQIQTATAVPQQVPMEPPKMQIAKSSTPVATQSGFFESILTYLKSVRESDVEVEIAPNGNEIIAVYYRLKRTWTLCIAVDESKKAIKMYAWFFKATHVRENDIYKMLNDWNREIPFVTFTAENTLNSLFVIAQTSLMAIRTRSLEKYVLNTADSLAKIIDDLFGTIPSDLIVD